ncbi:MAG: hypothetical protein HQ581_06015 [Planctomycetes bacterium]|nr:hypothetical protein [Planctomycetota bacterium]
MPSPASGSRESGPSPEPESRELPSTPAPGAEEAPDDAVLESVLRETLRADPGEDTDDPIDMGALREVVARHPGQPFSKEPIALEMVWAVLCDHFRIDPTGSVAWRAASAHIAETLFDDPRTRERLATLWNRLGGK